MRTSNPARFGGIEKFTVVQSTVKGGVGKTTLAVNIAIALSRKKRDVLLIDGDEQGTALVFTDLRTNDKDGEPIPGRPGSPWLPCTARTSVRNCASLPRNTATS